EAELRRRAEDRYHIVAEGLSDAQVAEIRRLNLKGVGVESYPERTYPAGDIAAQVVGRIGTERKGQLGAELAHDTAMQGSDGNLAFLRDARMRPLWIDERDYRPSKDGEDVRLSIDLVVQEIAERNLREAVKGFHAGGGRCVVMDVETGDILAIADTLTPRRGWTEVTTDPSRGIHPSLGRNRNVTDPYEPGSTFKPFVWAAATELGIALHADALQIQASNLGHLRIAQALGHDVVAILRPATQLRFDLGRPLSQNAAKRQGDVLERIRRGLRVGIRLLRLADTLPPVLPDERGIHEHATCHQAGRKHAAPPIKDLAALGKFARVNAMRACGALELLVRIRLQPRDTGGRSKQSHDHAGHEHAAAAPGAPRLRLGNARDRLARHPPNSTVGRSRSSTGS
ncbi:MAG: penicillin-binding transpeptidase domain-containing protein, partial [Planctomycetota bacterium]